MRLLQTPITPPAAEPVTLAECKGDARIDGAEFDALIPDYIAAARQACEQEIGAYLVTQVRRAESADWPGEDELICINPATAAAITYWDGATWATLGAGLYEMVQAAGGVVILPAPNAVWPTLGDKAGPRVRIDITCGYAADAAELAAARRWIRAHVVSAVDTPGSFVTGTNITPNPYLSGLLDMYRVYAR